MPIKLKLTADNVKEFIDLCVRQHCDINVLSGRVCVDGKSLIGVANMVGRVVQVAPVTFDMLEVEEFYRALQPLGAYREEF